MDNFEDLRPLPGGRISVDLLNTRWSPPGGRVDWLTDDAAVVFFAASHGVNLETSQINPARQALVDAREAIQKLFEATTRTEEEVAVDDAVAAEIDAVLRQADVRFAVTDQGPRVVISSADASRGLAIDATVDAVAAVGERPDRLRSCEHEDCTLWFLDTSKGGRRRWCSMESCGNRAKARRHYARTSQADDPEPGSNSAV